MAYFPVSRYHHSITYISIHVTQSKKQCCGSEVPRNLSCVKSSLRGSISHGCKSTLLDSRDGRCAAIGRTNSSSKVTEVSSDADATKRKQRRRKARPPFLELDGLILAVNRTSPPAENISDIFGMGHRSERRGRHCLYLSPRIELCLLTCIPSTEARGGTFQDSQDRIASADRETPHRCSLSTLTLSSCD